MKNEVFFCIIERKKEMERNKVNIKEAPLLDDYIFKRTFTKGSPNGILRDFLEAILDVHLKNVEVINAEIPKDIL